MFRPSCVVKDGINLDPFEARATLYFAAFTLNNKSNLFHPPAREAANTPVFQEVQSAGVCCDNEVRLVEREKCLAVNRAKSTWGYFS